MNNEVNYRFSHLYSCQRITVVLTSNQVQFLINPGFLFLHICHKLLVFQRLLKPLPTKKTKGKTNKFSFKCLGVDKISQRLNLFVRKCSKNSNIITKKIDQKKVK